MTVCSVLGCDSQSRTHPNYAFHRLPSSPAACQKWLRLMGRGSASLGLSPRVCSKHFEPTLYTQRGNARVLVLGAIPSLHLPKVENPEDYSELPLRALPPASKDNKVLLKKISWLRGKLVDARHNLRILKAKQRRDRKAKPPKANKVKMEPIDIATCRGCLALDTRLYGIRENGLEDAFVDVTGAPLSLSDGFPTQLCAICCTLLSKCAAFRDRCQRSQELLETLREWGPITTSDIVAIDRKSHKLTLNLHITDADKFDMTERESHAAWIKTETHDQDTHTFVDNYTHDDVDIKDSDDEIENKDDIKTEENEVTMTVKEEKPTKKRKLKSAKTTKTTKRAKSDNTKENSVCKRKVIGDDIYPDFDFGEFEKEYKCKIKVLSLKEQKQEIEDRKNSESFKKSPYGCDICGKSFSLEKSIRNHMTYHDPSAGPAECVICHLRFRSKKERFKHRDLHRMTYTCTECGFVARDKGFAKQHYNVHAGKKFACPHCPSVFSHQPSYFNHLRMLHPEQMVACPDCGETFASSLGVRQHRARAHRVNTVPKPEYKCTICDVLFFTTEALDKHILSATDSTHLSHKPCVSCGENCRSDEELAAHTAQSHPPDQFRCDECDKTFANASSFDTHHRRKHLKQRAPPRVPRPARPLAPGERRPRAPPPPGKRVVCEICGLLAQNETVLKYHLRIHQEIKPYPCTKCPKTFAAKHSLAWHLRTHTGERPFQCELCPLAFSLQSNWKRHHKVVHLGQRKSVPCELCDKTFTSRSGMKLHIATVHNNLPWPRRKRRAPRGGRELVGDS